MNYLFGYLKIPQSLTFAQLLFVLRKIEKQYKVDIGIERIKEEKDTFYLLKLYSRQLSTKVDQYRYEKITLVVDNALNIYKGDSINYGYIHF